MARKSPAERPTVCRVCGWPLPPPTPGPGKPREVCGFLADGTPSSPNAGLCSDYLTRKKQLSTLVSRISWATDAKKIRARGDLLSLSAGLNVYYPRRKKS